MTLQNRRSWQIGVSLALLVWFCGIAWLAATGFFLRGYRAFGLSSIQLAIFLPMIFFWILYLLVPPFAEFARSANLVFLVAVQAVRLLALSHVFSWGYGLMAGGFAIPVGLGNVLVCALALASVVAVAERRGRWWRRVYLLTFVGLAEFAMTVGLVVMGLFTMSLPFDPAPAIGGYITFATPPLSLFPTFAIPALTLVHFVTIVAVRHQAVEHAGVALYTSTPGAQTHA